jgi:hypothetical protein
MPIARPLPLVLGALLVLVACEAGPAPSADPTGAATPAESAPATASPDLSVAPVTPGTSEAPAGQTETEFGTIWDGVPEGFPRFRGGRDADDAGPAPASDVYAIEGADAGLVAEWLQSAMEDATYSTEGLSGPFEDGGYELVSVGEADCRIRTTITPQGSMILVTVLYGAACPDAPPPHRLHRRRRPDHRAARPRRGHLLRQHPRPRGLTRGWAGRGGVARTRHKTRRRTSMLQMDRPGIRSARLGGNRCSPRSHATSAP